MGNKIFLFRSHVNAKSKPCQGTFPFLLKSPRYLPQILSVKLILIIAFLIKLTNMDLKDCPLRGYVLINSFWFLVLFLFTRPEQT